MSSDARYRVARLDGYAASSSSREGDTATAGASFHVIDDLAGQLAAVYRSEETPAGLPPAARIRIAERRAHERAAELQAKHAETIAP